MWLFFLCCSNRHLVPANWEVYSGVVSLNSLPEPYMVEKIILDENYNTQTNDRDVALIKLRNPVDFDGQLWVCLILNSTVKALWPSCYVL